MYMIDADYLIVRIEKRSHSICIQIQCLQSHESAMVVMVVIDCRCNKRVFLCDSTLPYKTAPTTESMARVKIIVLLFIIQSP